MSSARPSAAPVMVQKAISTFTVGWFIVSSILCAIDASFVLLRPGTLPGGNLVDYFPIWKGWHTYIKYDKRYASMTDGWVVLQSWLNLLEIAISYLSILFLVIGWRSASLKVAAAVSVMTAYKTIIYFGMEYADGFPFTKHNSTSDLLLYVVLPSSFWVFIPFYCARNSLYYLTSVVKPKGE
jgi:hypothetical protein